MFIIITIISNKVNINFKAIHNLIAVLNESLRQKDFWHLYKVKLIFFLSLVLKY